MVLCFYLSVTMLVYSIIKSDISMNLSASRFSLLGLSILVAAFILTPFFASAQSVNECSFSRTLEMGVDGEDVRCLQTYLN